MTPRDCYGAEGTPVVSAMLQWILAHINNAKFRLTAPDPRTFQGIYTGDYYVGDRTGECLYYIVDNEDVAQYTLKLKFIEY